MSDAFSPASQAAEAMPPMRSRAELIDAIHDLSRRTRDAVDADALGLGEQILAAVRAGQVLHADEAARAEVVVTELLDGADSAYAWERVADAELYEAWMTAQTENPAAWVEDVAPTTDFPDAIWLRPIQTSGHDFSLSREALRDTVAELVEHVGTNPDQADGGAARWESQLREMADAIVSTIRTGDVVTAGEAARLDRLVAAAVNFEDVRGPAGEDTWSLTTDPDAYQTWLTARAVRIVGHLTSDRSGWTNERGEFVDAAGLRPFRPDSLHPGDHQLLDRAGVEQAFAQLCTAADPFMEQTLLTRPRDLLDRGELRFVEAAEAILVTARATDVLTVSEAGRAERVVASLASGEYDATIVRDNRAWQLVTDPAAYREWVSTRNRTVAAATGQDSDSAAVERDVMAEQVAALRGDLLTHTGPAADEPAAERSSRRQAQVEFAAGWIIENPALAPQLLSGEDHDELVTAIVTTAHEQLREWQSLRQDYTDLRSELAQLRATLNRTPFQPPSHGAALEFPVPVNTQAVEPSQPWWRPWTQVLGGGRSDRGASR
ncbi:hypothetical protein [Nocardia gipuzkoensis]|uniref:hypothetical protein n=1 Tax=Nocardia gipuzkoensis TaxID=2749991 RepID=UPI0015EE7EA8|nr:hypothetical protein [Nocardia gipuzkoensis]